MNQQYLRRNFSMGCGMLTSSCVESGVSFISYEKTPRLFTESHITHDSSHTHVDQTSNVFQDNSSRSHIKMASESENRDADSASSPTTDPPYVYVRNFYTRSDKVSNSKNFTFLCKLGPPEKLAIIKKKMKMN